MKVTNQTGSTMTIQTIEIASTESYEVPVANQEAWSKDPAMRAGVRLGNITCSWRDPNGTEFIADSSQAAYWLREIVQGTVDRQEPL